MTSTAYCRSPDGTLAKQPAVTRQPGTLVSLQGGKGRRYRAPVVLGPNNKPVLAPLRLTHGGSGRVPTAPAFTLPPPLVLDALRDAPFTR